MDHVKSTKISVIVPIYNVEEYLDKCLFSLVNQTLQDIEIILVNDGSPDNSQVIIDSYAQKYPHLIKAYTKENGGLSDARNFGISKANGEYLAFVDSDDYVDIDMYEQMYNKAIQTESDVVCCPITHVYARNVYKKFLNESAFGKSVLESPTVLHYSNSLAWNKIYKRDFWVANDFKFPVGQWFEDSAVIYNALFMANKIECVNIPFYNYVREREGAITHTIDERIFDIFKSCDSIIEFYKSKGVFSKLEKNITYLCVRHIYARFSLLLKYDNSDLKYRYLNLAFEYLDKHFTNWRECEILNYTRRSSLKRKIACKINRNKKLLKIRMMTPKKLAHLIVKLASYRPKFKLIKKINEKKRTEKVNESKRVFVRKNGYSVMCELQGYLKEIGITCFADFGTLLGIIREGKLLNHDLDVDLGVIISDSNDMQKLHVALERRGFKLWRQYIFDKQLVQESYHYKRIKVDLNFYEMTSEYAKTWLFYRDPSKTYTNNNRDIVEMKYSPILGFETISVNNEDILIPQNPEEFLKEKYGEGWLVPNTGWIYWKSPAATKINKVGYYMDFKYSGSIHVDSEDEFNEKQIEQLKITKEMQEYTYGILKDIKFVCEDNKINYFLGSSTLLGAIRHNDFIPWDARVAIFMERKDYNLFLEIAQSQLGKNYSVQNCYNTKNYWTSNMQVRLKNNLEFYQENISKLTPDSGLYVDIFPLETVSKIDTNKQFRQKNKIMRLNMALEYKLDMIQPNSLKKKLFCKYAKLQSVKDIHSRIEKIVKLSADENGKYLIDLVGYHSYDKSVFKRSSFFGDEIRYEKFRDDLYPVPVKSEDILKKIYGNYKKVSPVFSRRFNQINLRERPYFRNKK